MGRYRRFRYRYRCIGTSLETVSNPRPTASSRLGRIKSNGQEAVSAGSNGVFGSRNDGLCK
ncbi:hypothetical protein E2C01_060533 [Portunus trituberculatus]|uniref:Uncharacterized protein n=1 Tax=Portunus trituberculatus TaxID=210409 RepID=A0A5B7H8Y9_PORTR|nr:hypothetical protein [Portunus trituberculatus]